VSECEVCGKQDAGYIVLVEGARMRVCRECSSLGKIITMPSVPQSARSQADVPYAFREELELVDDYGERIKKAREAKGLPLPVLAERIAEKESFLEHVEAEKMHPSESLCRKLEKELGIKLLETVASSSAPNRGGGGGKPGPVTLGDIIEIEKKEKKK
jgi:putative transcription factor